MIVHRSLLASPAKCFDIYKNLHSARPRKKPRTEVDLLSERVVALRLSVAHASNNMSRHCARPFLFSSFPVFLSRSASGSRSRQLGDKYSIAADPINALAKHERESRSNVRHADRIISTDFVYKVNNKVRIFIYIVISMSLVNFLFRVNTLPQKR